MPWFKVDDGLHAHKKAVRAGVPAMGLWVLAGTWCADQLSDGWVPDYIAARLDRDYEEHAAALVKAGLWVADEQDGDQGWRFHQWEEHQPSAKSVLDKREEAKERMRRVREARRSGSQSVRANTERTNDEVRLTPTRPDPTRTKELPSEVLSAAAPQRPPASATQRSKRITDAYAAVEPMCKWVAVNAVVLKAIKAEKYSDDEIRDALLRLAKDGRSVTVDTLRIELNGMPASKAASSGYRGPFRNPTDHSVYESGL